MSDFVRTKSRDGRPFDQVRRERERRTGEPDQRHVGVERTAEQAHRFQHVGHVALRLERRQCAHRRLIPHGRLDHRPDAVHDIEWDAGAEERRHDVGEENGSVERHAAQRLQRHLDRHLRALRYLDQRQAFTERAILGQDAACLTHEPDGCAIDGLAPGGADEQRRGCHVDLPRQPTSASASGNGRCTAVKIGVSRSV